MKYNWIFRTGGVLLLLGCLGLLIQFVFSLEWKTAKLASFLPKSTVALVHLNLSETLPSSEREHWWSWINQDFSTQYGFEIWPQIEPWNGEDIALVWLENKEKVWLFNYKNKKKAQSFLRNFLLEGEVLNWTHSDGFSMATPAFSADLFFGFKEGWLVIARSQVGLETILNRSASLLENEGYQKIQTDLPKQGSFFLFADTHEFLQAFPFKDSWRPYKPLFQATSVILPYVSGVWELRTDGTALLSAKIVTHNSVYTSGKIPQNLKANIPKLARFTPADAFFFLNGHDLLARYEQTKSFLNQLDPQLNLIFQGLIKGESERIFGLDFDLEKQLLPLLNKDYAFWFDFNPSTKALDFTFLLDLENALSQKSSQDILEGEISDLRRNMKAVLEPKQAGAEPVIKRVELPDGTTREELVIGTEVDALVSDETYQGKPYSVFASEDFGAHYAYGFFRDVFAFSTDEKDLKSVIEVHQGKRKALSEREDFLETLRYHLSLSQSYGFVNVSKLRDFMDLLVTVSIEPKASTSFLSHFGSSIFDPRYESIIFSRKIFPEEVFLKAVWSQRGTGNEF